MKKTKKEKRAVCTIISKNYLAHARVLAKSFKKYNKQTEVFVLLVDELEGFFNPNKEPFKLIKLNELAIPDIKSLCFKYNILELNTAVKPFFLEFLLKKYGLSKIIYFDPDILVLSNMDELFKSLDNYSIILTPHRTKPFADNHKPDEIDFLGSGVYNLGFIGLSKNEITTRLIDWWKERLHEYCFASPKDNLFVDQLWINFIHCFFEKILILKEPGYNVAYWNLTERNVTKINDKFLVNGKQLFFFHFSGFDPNNLNIISKYQDRFVMRNLNQETQELFKKYQALLLKEGYAQIIKWPYKFGKYEDGSKIFPEHRRLYAQNINRFKGKNPFSTKENCFYKMTGKKNKIAGTYIKLFNSKIIQRPKNILKRAIGLKRFEKIKSKLIPFHKFLLKTNVPQEKKIPKKKLGINITGYLDSESGVGEAARSIAEAVKTTGIPLSLNNNQSTPAHKGDKRFEPMFSDKNPHPFNIIAVNADRVIDTWAHLGPQYFKDKYNIGIWNWELESFPKEWVEAINYVDEIWVPSLFIQDAIAKISNKPVVRIPYPIKLSGFNKFDRNYFKIPKEKFVFLFIFDFCSIFERKNPLAAIEAFKKAIGNKNSALFLIKCSNSSFDKNNFEKLLESAKGAPIKILSDTMSREEINSLINLCDCYVSLHRSEGYGFTIAEAMYLGKPVIATDYSANKDFMKLNNSFPVKYSLTKIKEDHGPYKKGQYWAEPDINHAASLMEYVQKNKEEAKKIGSIAKEDIMQNLSPKNVGEMIKERIKIIYERL